VAPKPSTPKQSKKVVSGSTPIRLRHKGTDEGPRNDPLSLPSGPSNTSGGSPSSGSHRHRSIGIRHVAWAALALVGICIALSAWIIMLQAEVRTNHRELASITQERDTLRQQATATSYRLGSTPDGPDNAAAIVFLSIEGSGVLSATNLPRLGTNQAFQLWYRPSGGGSLVPGGTFPRDQQGSGFMLIPSDVGTFDALSISVEPASGSTVPSGAMILQGDVNGAKG